MKSKTSCYDPATGRMTLRRFAPVWVLYTVGLLLLTVINMSSSQYNNRSTEDLLYSLQEYCTLMGAVNFVYALVLAQLQFGDLYTSRLCYAIHALPVTRGGWFGTQVILGLLGSLFPNLLNAGVLLLFLKEFRITVLWWLAASELQFLFFFGAAVLCAICAANRLGMVVLYGIVNFANALGAWLWMKLYASLIYGMYITEIETPLSPLVQLMLGVGLFDIHTTTTAEPDSQQAGIYKFRYVVDGVSLTSDFWLLFVYAAVGVAAIWLAMRLYRKRKNEYAGDLLAFPGLELPVLILCTLAAGGVGHLVAYVFNVNLRYPLLFAGMIVGYYVCLMLLRRQIKVFTGRSVPLLAGLCAAMLLSLALTGLDPLGVTDRVPDAQEVASVNMTFYHSSTRATETSDPELIGKVLEVHQQALLEHREREASRPLLTRIFGDEGQEISLPATEDMQREMQRIGLIYICYTMKDGSTLNRVYQIPETSPAMEPMREYFSRPEVVFSDLSGVLSGMLFVDENESLDGFLDSVEMVGVACNHEEDEFYSEMRSKILDPEQIRELVDAILADCAQGNAVPYGIFHDLEKPWDNVTFIYHTAMLAEDAAPETVQSSEAYGIESSISFTVTIYPECTNTLSWLAEHGYHVPAQESAE